MSQAYQGERDRESEKRTNNERDKKKFREKKKIEGEKREKCGREHYNTYVCNVIIINRMGFFAHSSNEEEMKTDVNHTVYACNNLRCPSSLSLSFYPGSLTCLVT